MGNFRRNQVENTGSVVNQGNCALPDSCLRPTTGALNMRETSSRKVRGWFRILASGFF